MKFENTFPPDWTPDRQAAFWADWKQSLNLTDAENKYREMLEHPETLLSLESVLKELELLDPPGEKLT